MTCLAPYPVRAPKARGQERARARVTVRGAVQGVGFRPFIFRLASRHGLAGWVSNSPQGVFIEVEGGLSEVEHFLLRIERDRPPLSFIQSLESVYLDPVGYHAFEIRPSDTSGEKTALVLPDIATCPDCLRELFDPANRRFGYPFTNCTHCGPRFSIIEALPYDRPNTSMRRFTLCDQCQAEYDNPLDRRFHAQPNACPACGPRIELWDAAGKPVASPGGVIGEAARLLRQGGILALKGLGGFHLLALASDDGAVRRLRQRKHREEKPFAVMFPTLDAVRTVCDVSAVEARALRSPESPIVLLRRIAHDDSDASASRVASSVAPANPFLGVMLPYTPLHHLLLAELGMPLVATSGNLSDEPICIDEHEALERLGSIADLFLVHNRPIVRHVDDSVLTVVLGREMVLRRARGFAPLPIRSPILLRPTLAVGAHLKNTVALAAGHQVFLSQHIGDLESAPALAAFKRVIQDLERLYDITPEVIAADAHPDYLSTQHAQESGQAVVSVQHHHAHVLACMAENELSAPVLGVAWDGTGCGLDGSIWGGEFFRVTQDSIERVGHVRSFPLPGGDKAVNEPRRAALGLLYQTLDEEVFTHGNLAPVEAFSAVERRTLRKMLASNVNCPMTSSVGRLFDAVASITGLRQRVHFEGQAALDLEFAMDPEDSDGIYPLGLIEPAAWTAGDGILPPPELGGGGWVVDWAPMVQQILDDLSRGVPVWKISARFHNALAEGVVAMAQQVKEPRVVLSGGCFQNKYLVERTVTRLRREGFSPYWHQRVPPNDGGIALGQIMAAARASQKR